MLRSRLCHYSDAYIVVSATITVSNTAANSRKNIVIKNCASFTYCISEINNTQIDNVKCIDIVIPVHNFTEYSHNIMALLMR